MAKKKSTKKIVKKEVNINDVIKKAEKYFARPITIKDKEEFYIDIKGENGIKKEELFEYISNIKDSRIKKVFIKDDNIRIEL